MPKSWIYRVTTGLLLGLTLTGCPTQRISGDDDAPGEPTGTPETTAPSCSCTPENTATPFPGPTPTPTPVPETPYPDLDGDGVAPAEGDCDDRDAQSHPGGCELPLNGRDDDCGEDGDATSGSLACAQARITGMRAEDKIGFRVQDIGDLDLDGHHDVVIGGIFSYVGALDADSGRAFLAYGPFSADRPLEVVQIDADSPYEVFGRDAVALNFTGDFCPELVLSAIGYDGQRGRIAIVPGAPGEESSPAEELQEIRAEFQSGSGCRRLTSGPVTDLSPLFLEGAHLNDRFGDDLLNLGSLGEGGYDALLVSASQAAYSSDSGDVEYAGAAYLFYGREDASTLPTSASGADVVFLGRSQGGIFGSSLGLVLLGDSGQRPVIAIAAGGENMATIDGGAVYLYPVPPPPAALEPLVLDADAAAVLAGSLEGEGLGSQVVSGTDLDDDRSKELLVTSQYRSDGRTWGFEGGVYLFTGAQLEAALELASRSDTQQLLTTADAAATWIGAYESEQLGRGVSFMEDLTEDGIPDILMSVNSTGDDEIVGEGRVFVLSGDPATWPSEQPLIVTNESAEAAFLGEAPDQDAGDSLSGVVGWTGFVVSAPGWDGPGCLDCGAAYFVSLERPTARTGAAP